MMDMRHRTVHFYDVVLATGTRAEGISNPSGGTITALLERVKRSAIVGARLTESNRLTVEISDWHHDISSGAFCVLINRADANVSDVTFRDLKTRVARRAGKTRVEGIELSAHVVIKPDADGRRAMVLLTMGSGISSDTLEKLFREAARLVLGDTKNSDLLLFDHPSGEKDRKGVSKKYRVHYSFDCFAHKGQVLDQALKNGSFSSMELVAHEYSGFDSGGNLQVTQQTITVTAANPHSVTAATLVRDIKRFFAGTP